MPAYYVLDSPINRRIFQALEIRYERRGFGDLLLFYVKDEQKLFQKLVKILVEWRIASSESYAAVLANSFFINPAPSL